MKLLYIPFIAFYLLSACQRDNKKPILSTNKTIKSPKIKMEVNKITELPWEVKLNDTTELLELKKNLKVNPGNIKSDAIIEVLNLKYPQIKLEWIGQKGNRAFVKILNATYLTQQMGSTGPQAYFAESTYSLTEVPGINAVSFDFIEGDHASPQTYTRESFRDFN